MRFREPLHLFQLIVIAGLPVIASGCVEAVIDTDCIDTIKRSYHFESPADPPLQFRIDRCHLDVGACKELCQEALERDEVTGTEPSRCNVSFSSDSVSVDVSFEVFTGGEDCPEDDIPPPGPIFVGPPEAGDTSGPASLDSTPAPASAALVLPPESHARELSARTLESLWNGGRSCHA